MSLFDSISNLFNNSGGAQPSEMAGPIMNELEQNGIGGVSGLVSQFEQSGFGSHIASWVGTGQNLPIDANTVQQVLGQPMIANLAAKFGVDEQQASAMIAQHLPGVVDHLTPSGQVPT